MTAVYALRTPVRGETESSGPTERDPIAVSADFSQSWLQQRESVVLLRGRCQIVQGSTTLRSNKMVIWRRSEGPAAQLRERITVYLEDDVRLERPGDTRTERTLLLDLVTRSGITLQAGRRVADQSAAEDALFVRAARRRGTNRPGAATVQQAQFTPFDAGPELQSVQLQPSATGLRRIRVFPRSAVDFDVESFESKTTTPSEQIWIIRGGVTVLIDGVEQIQGTVDLAADRMVIWSQLAGNAEFSGEKVQTNDAPLEVYLEGNVIIRQGIHVLRATQAFFDAPADKALLLNAELKTSIPDVAGRFRVRAERLRQLSGDTFQAQRAWITTSEFGKPGYRLQASDIFLEPRTDGPLFDGSGGAQVDPFTGEPLLSKTPWATTLNNTFYVSDVPLFYFPYLAFPAEDPNIPLRNVTFENDRIFGAQLYTSWNVFKLFGMNRPAGTSLNWHLDYLNKRGPQTGLSGNYRGVGRFGLDGAYIGSGLGYYIHDAGRDNLGADRPDLIPSSPSRGRMRLRDRQEMPFGFSLISEIGWLSDRNYLEQYDKTEYDAGKDYETLMYLKQQQNNWAWSVLARPRLYNYFNETAWLPRGDLFLLSQPVFNTPVTFSGHGYYSYASQRIADRPTDPRDLYTTLPFEGNAQGVVLSKRGEVDLPFALGPLHVVPYGLGGFDYWGQDYSGESLHRWYGSAGARGSIEFWKVFPEVRSTIFNLNGLAHKMVFDADYSYSQADADLSAVPQFNEFDDNAQEQFRRRLLVNTFGGTLPATFDPRFYAVRAGAAHDVTSPYHELIADQQVLRLGWRHRLQTKVGPVNAPRIKNWMTLDLETSFFPDSQRDNFDQDFGLYGARYNWAVGDSTSLNASAYWDTFDKAQHLWNVGVSSQRSTRGNVYLAFRQVEGAGLRSQIVTASYNYTLSSKWVTSLSTAYDVGSQMNLGQNVTFTRIGADFLVQIGAVIDPLHDNFGFGVSITPRFASFLGGAGSPLGSMLSGTNQNNSRTSNGL